MKKVTAIIGLLSISFSLSAFAGSPSCEAQFQALLDKSINTGIVDGRESELRDQVNKGTVKEEAKSGLSARVEFLQSIRLKMQDGAGANEIEFAKNCLK